MLRFATSPTGDMNLETLRVAMFNYMVAKQKDVHFIVRIEDMEKEKNIEGKDTEILQILEKFALPHDSVSHQSENLHIHQTLAIRLLEEKKAFVENEVLAQNKDEKVPFDICIKEPENTETDSFVILKKDSTPSYLFASACDDMISGVTCIIREEDKLPDMAKERHIQQLLGYEQEIEYIHLSPLATKNDNISVKWLFEQGFIPDAIANYLILLGNKVPQEIFTMPEALEWFNIENMSRSSEKFDREKLRDINRQHLKRMDDKKLSTLFGFADADIGKLAKLYLEEAGTINELASKIRPFFTAKNFDTALGEQMRILEKIILDAPMIDSYDEFTAYLMQKSRLKDENFYNPLRLLLTGAASGPELSDIYPLIKPYLLEVAS